VGNEVVLEPQEGVIYSLDGLGLKLPPGTDGRTNKYDTFNVKTSTFWVLWKTILIGLPKM